jgi:hypothetical protein
VHLRRRTELPAICGSWQSLPASLTVTNVKVYCASKAKHAVWWQALRGAGISIEAPWIDAELNQPGAPEVRPDQWQRHWRDCIANAADADVVLFYAGEDERQCGALLECGAALAAGKQVFVVSPYEWTFAHHERCRRFDTLEDAIRALRAMEAGETARVVAMDQRFLKKPHNGWEYGQAAANRQKPSNFNI